MALTEEEGDGGGRSWRGMGRKGRQRGAECSFKWKLALSLMARTSNDDPPPPSDYFNVVSAFLHAHTLTHTQYSHNHHPTRPCKNLLMTHTHTHSSKPSRDEEQRESVMMHHFLKHLDPSSLSHHLSLSAFHTLHFQEDVGTLPQLCVCTDTAVLNPTFDFFFCIQTQNF